MISKFTFISRLIIFLILFLPIFKISNELWFIVAGVLPLGFMILAYEAHQNQDKIFTGIWVLFLTFTSFCLMYIADQNIDIQKSSLFLTVLNIICLSLFIIFNFRNKQEIKFVKQIIKVNFLNHFTIKKQNNLSYNHLYGNISTLIETSPLSERSSRHKTSITKFNILGNQVEYCLYNSTNISSSDKENAIYKKPLSHGPYSYYNISIDNLIERKTHSYNVNNTKTEECTFDSIGILCEKTIYSFNDFGEKSEEITYDSSLNLIFKWKFLYDNSGNLITKSCFNEMNEQISITKINYDSNRMIVKIIHVNPAGKCWNLIYHKQMQKIEETFYYATDVDNKFTVWHSYKNCHIKTDHFTNGTTSWYLVFYKFGSLKEYRYISCSNPSYHIIEVYNWQKCLLSHKRYFEKHVEFSENYKYNHIGELLEKEVITYDSKDSEKSHLSYVRYIFSNDSYDYDAFHNWVKRSEFCSGVGYDITIREFDYFD